MKSRKNRWADRVTCMEEENCLNVFGGEKYHTENTGVDEG
jgi:hypothetical protein